jgi:hypothetical protein
MMGWWRIVLAVLLAVTLAFWIISLVGTASMQARRRERREGRQGSARALAALRCFFVFVSFAGEGCVVSAAAALFPAPQGPPRLLPSTSCSTKTTSKKHDKPNNPKQAVCSASSLDSLHAGGAPFRPALSCGSALRLPWVFLVLEALALVGVSLSICIGGLAHSAFSWLAIFAVLSAVCVFIADAMVALQSTPAYAGGDEGDRARTAQAGWVPLAALNALVAFWLGWRQQGHHHAGAAGGGVLPMTGAAGAGSPVVKY